jgi:hypothetical protein
MTRVKISRSRFSFLRRCLGLGRSADLKEQRRALKESPADPEIIWVRLVTGKEHRMSAIPDGTD